MLSIEIEKDSNKIKKQIKALEYAIKQDSNTKDLEIHTRALEDLKLALKILDKNKAKIIQFKK